MLGYDKKLTKSISILTQVVTHVQDIVQQKVFHKFSNMIFNIKCIFTQFEHQFNATTRTIHQ